MPSTQSSLVLGSASQLDPEVFEPFYASLKRTGFAGSTVLLALDYSDAELDKFREFVDEVVSLRTPSRGHRLATRGLRFLQGTRGLRRFYSFAFRARLALVAERRAKPTWETLELRLEGLQSVRYERYLQFLAQRPGEFEQVLLCDVRDVVFQSDPFEVPVQRLEFFQEDPSHRVATEPFLNRWLTRLEGPSFVSSHADEIASCSGTVIGPIHDILSYLGLMSTGISWRRIPMGNHDQGVHNALIFGKAFPAAAVVPNGTGRVLTMGGMAQPPVDEPGVAHNVDGTLPAVVHQYDRFPHLASRIQQRWAQGDADVDS